MIIGPVDLLDGTGRRGPVNLELREGRITDIQEIQASNAPRRTLLPGLIDLQVNGGGGLMLNDAQSTGDIDRIQNAHRQLGTAQILPTLISDTPDTTTRILRIAKDHPDLLGLHLEGPHLAIAGAHDPSLLRPMTDADLADYLQAAQDLPNLMITLAPEMVTLAQISRLAEAGVIVALGHSACTYDAARAAFDAGARMVTHLFNAMSGLHHRNPGLVGAALDAQVAFGLIADGHHVHDAAIRLAWHAGQDRMIPVSDTMALTGSSEPAFSFQGREINAEATRLTLADGTLAGARASLLDGLRNLARATGTPLAEVLMRAVQGPRALLGLPLAKITPGAPAELLQLSPDGRIDALIDGQWRAV